MYVYVPMIVCTFLALKKTNFIPSPQSYLIDKPNIKPNQNKQHTNKQLAF